jgi:hypothetical protein
MANSFDFVEPAGTIFSSITKSILSDISIALGDKINAVLGSSISKAVSGITGSISSSLGGGIVGNIIGASVGNGVGGTLYGVAGTAVGEFAGTLNKAFSQTFSVIDKMGGVAGVGFNVPNLVSSAFSGSGQLLVSNLTGVLTKAGISVGSAAGVALSSGFSDMFNRELAGMNNWTMDSRNSLTNPSVEINAVAEKLFGSGNLIYPKDLGGYFICFEFGDYAKNNVFDPGATIVVEGTRVFLPIPTNLVESYDLMYNETGFGPVAGWLTESAKGSLTKGGMSGLISDSFNAVDGSLNPNAITQSMMALADKEGQLNAGGFITNNLYAATRAAAGELSGYIPVFGEHLGPSLDTISGLTPNPHLAMLFQGVKFKNYTFSWKLSPNNKDESDVIRDIIKIFKMNAAPVKDGWFLKYPSIVFATLVTQGDAVPNTAPPYLFAFKPMVIDGIGINYTGAGTPAFHGSGAPVEIDIQIRLREIALWYREDMADGDLTPGSDEVEAAESSASANPFSKSRFDPFDE